MYPLTVQCDEPATPENGVIVTLVTVIGRGEGDTLTFQCNSGFAPIGVMSSVCTSNGTWFPNPGTVQCSPGELVAGVILHHFSSLPLSHSVTCPILQTPSNASSNFPSERSLFGTTVHLQCDPGLFPEGVRRATCLESGDWDHELSQLMCREMPSELYRIKLVCHCRTNSLSYS